MVRVAAAAHLAAFLVHHVPEQSARGPKGHRGGQQHWLRRRDGSAREPPRHGAAARDQRAGRHPLLEDARGRWQRDNEGVFAHGHGGGDPLGGLRDVDRGPRLREGAPVGEAEGLWEVFGEGEGDARALRQRRPRFVVDEHKRLHRHQC